MKRKHNLTFKSYTFIIAIVCCIGSLNLFSKTIFTENAIAFGIDTPGNKDGGHAWADYDDGDIDLLATATTTKPLSKVYCNNKDKTVTNSYNNLSAFNIGINNPPTATIIDYTNTDTNTGTATVEATNGIPPYTYLWDDSIAQTTTTATGLTAGTYTVIVTDSDGSTDTASVIITVAQQVPFTIRYQDSFRGDIIYVSNNNLSRHATNNFNEAGSNDQANQVYVDIDSDASTFNSSSSDLVLPSTCSEIAFAGLYWAGTYPYESGLSSGGPNDANRFNPDNIEFKLPGGTY